ncbi:IS3 family transposase [Secundilactobacillus kimchicus]|uniref:IS3 family transposase n=1 Tax=Secundilactobacillus kimchicus TaxID=528209 RepID=UPI0009E7BAAB
MVQTIKQLRSEHEDCGYRPMTEALKHNGYEINHKTTSRLMKAHNLLCHAFDRRTKKYNSHVGTVVFSPNRLNRRFMTDRPYQKIMTDVTELR